MKHGMAFYCTLFFLVLSIALLNYVCCTRPSSLATAALQGRSPRRLLSTYQGIRDEKSQVVEGEELWTSSGFDDMDESVYHLDYHGVKTHPSPTPKTPMP